MKHKVHEGDFGGVLIKLLTKTKMILNVKNMKNLISKIHCSYLYSIFYLPLFHFHQFFNIFSGGLFACCTWEVKVISYASNISLCNNVLVSEIACMMLWNLYL